MIWIQLICEHLQLMLATDAYFLYCFNIPLEISKHKKSFNSQLIQSRFWCDLNTSTLRTIHLGRLLRFLANHHHHLFNFFIPQIHERKQPKKIPHLYSKHLEIRNGYPGYQHSTIPGASKLGSKLFNSYKRTTGVMLGLDVVLHRKHDWFQCRKMKHSWLLGIYNWYLTKKNQ